MGESFICLCHTVYFFALFHCTATTFGGFKQSGKGRELGRYGLEEFLEYKSLQFKPADKT